MHPPQHLWCRSRSLPSAIPSSLASSILLLSASHWKPAVDFSRAQPVKLERFQPEWQDHLLDFYDTHAH